ncbi:MULTISPECIES: CesT family type III secretion system chaperone [unclassified Brenneria]|uniref:CesT family type III secretion system chaperone n=1 Tax=unclassified Brenneria TaxID=2634434 RepID=UPI0029C5DDCD|nr:MULTISPECIES: CesT family type III secretion system chaperone [unclassified Brenneria]MDX5630442.1 CesT family type III secretion system chaperone [Brenneria sp. L3-3Z]MDX5697587.1 CesT family type III secretion system chaperone [Brenneria sp. L4-2C]MEE3664326.1 CesT family type III secretion system chaperone [Brenneria sp. g21c3]
MSEANYARALLLRWMEKQTAVDGMPNLDTGVTAMLNGQELLLRLPETRETLFIFTPVYTLDFARDGELLALGLMLNLEPGLMCGAAIGLETQRRQLMLTAHQDIRAFDDRMLSAWLESAVALALRIREEFSSLAGGRKTSTAAHASPFSAVFRTMRSFDAAR